MNKNLIINNVEKTKTCWIWKKSCNNTGYGQLKIKEKHYTAHRLAYLIFKGEIPTNQIVRHTCHNRICCNPEHLILGTKKDNWYDSEEIHRETAKKRRKVWKVGNNTYKTCREAVKETKISIHSIIKFTKDGVFDIEEYRKNCEIANVTPKI